MSIRALLVGQYLVNSLLNLMREDWKKMSAIFVLFSM